VHVSSTKPCLYSQYVILIDQSDVLPKVAGSLKCGEKFSQKKKKSKLQSSVRNWKAMLCIEENKNKQLINGLKEI